MRREDLSQPHFAAVDVFEYPVLHEHSVAELSFNRALTKLLHTAGMRDFNLRDVMHPTYKRSRAALSAVINFAKFREDRLASYQDFTAKTDELLESHRAVDETNQELLAVVRKLRADRAKDQPFVDALKGETAALQSEVARYNAQQASLKETIAGLKGKFKAVQEDVDNDRFKLMNAKQACVKLRQQIVPSPEKLRKNIAELGIAVEAEKCAAAAAERKAAELDVKHDALARVEKDVTKANKKLNECEDEKSAVTEVKQENKALLEKIAENDKAMRDCVNNEQNTRHKLTAAQEKQSRMTKQMELKEANAVDGLEQARAQLISAESYKDESESQLNKENLAMVQLKNKMGEARKQHTQEMETTRLHWTNCENQLLAYHATLIDAMGGTVA